jgi:hypothetical protein
VKEGWSSRRAPAATMLLAAVVIGVGAPPALAAPPISPVGRALVVTANVQEAYGRRDMARTGDLAVFVKRVLGLASRPDVLLLQEVRHSSAAFVARRLTAATGSRYAVVVGPGRRPVTIHPHKTVHRETAILLNRDTMEARSRGGYVTTSYTRAQSSGGRKPAVRKQAFVLARERRGGLLLPLASVHLAPRPSLRNRRTSNRLRRRWAVAVANTLSTRYGGAGRFPTIGGDFNSGRCVAPDGRCKAAPFWAALTGDRWRYRDSVQDLTGEEGVDYVFTRGGVHGAGIDSYNQHTSGDRFYSDHRFRWAVIGSDTTRPTRPTTLGARGAGERDVELSWSPSHDQGGSGVDSYEVWRARPGSDFRMVARVATTRWRDTNTYRTRTYVYYVRAVDGAHNRSLRSDTRRITV